jgi:hypothetical protein
MKTVKGKGKVKKAVYKFFPVFLKPAPFTLISILSGKMDLFKTQVAIKDKEKKEAQRRNTRASPHLDPPSSFSLHTPFKQIRKRGIS